MKPVKISIEGDYIDCQIYRGRLYLWTINGKLCVYDWNRLVGFFAETGVDNTALNYAFTDGDALYENSLMTLFEDTEFKTLLSKKFELLESHNLQITPNCLSKFLIGEMDTPTLDLPIDTEIYNNKLYFITEKGLFCATAHKQDGNPVSSKPNKLWDARILSIKANRFPQIAISAGSDGLFELNNSKSQYSTRTNVEKNIYQLSGKHSSFANYSGLSIYSSSLYGESYMACFDWSEQKNRKIREWEREINESEIFKTNYKPILSWGIDGRIFKLTDNGFETVKITKTITDIQQPILYSLRDVQKNDVIGGTSTYFGNIVEYANSLLVVQTDDDCFRINGPITRWRTYPRSRNYENQLHVILDDCIEIYSFNHDYFLSQIDKRVGIEYIANNEKPSFSKKAA